MSNGEGLQDGRRTRVAHDDNLAIYPLVEAATSEGVDVGVLDVVHSGAVGGDAVPGESEEGIQRARPHQGAVN